MLYRGQTKTGKPRYSFGRMGQSQGELVTELPAGFTISESVNGVVSLVKDRPSLLMPMEVAAVEEAVKQHPRAIASNLGDRLYKPCYSKPNFQALPYRCPLQAALKFRCDCPDGGSQRLYCIPLSKILAASMQRGMKACPGSSCSCFLSRFTRCLFAYHHQ